MFYDLDGRQRFLYPGSIMSLAVARRSSFRHFPLFRYVYMISNFKNESNSILSIQFFPSSETLSVFLLYSKVPKLPQVSPYKHLVSSET